MSILVLMLVMSLVAAACGGGDGGDEEETTTQTGEAERGGTLVWESEEFGFVGGFDPVGEYLGEAWGVMTNLMIRNLVNYKHLPGEEGNEIVEDLAVEVPEVSEGQTEYTFQIKDGIMFGPPVSREIVCEDFEYAFRRIATESLVAQYKDYYEGVIEGLEVGEDPGPGGISGITCNGDKEITFTLTKPTGDFLYRLAMPAAAPQPEEIAGCFTKAGEYGRYLVSSGPYMFEGSDEMSTNCDDIKPVSGYDPDAHQKLVRNPDYDQETDDYRENWFDEWHHIINTNTNDLEQRIEDGQNDIVYTPTPQTLREFSTDPDKKERLHINPGDRTWYITMNLNEPPFDDINVRKALNYVMDKEGLQRAWGGQSQGDIATHIIPDTMLNDELADYDPYPSPNNAGDEEAAKAAMKESKYDSDGDGVCDDPVCDGVLLIGSNTPPGTDMLPVIESSLEKIGITLEPREITDAYTPILTVKRRVPISSRPGWGKDYPDVYTFAKLFKSEFTVCEGNYNYSLVGLDEAKAEECGVPFNNPDIPNVDDKINECFAVPQGDERISCWAEFDQQLMEEVVPWVPYLDANAIYAASEDITKFEFDQFSTTPAWSRVAVDPNS